jgi:site-specific recombinase XerD
LVQDGVPLYDVGALLGHSSPSVTARYAHLRPDAHGVVEAAWDRIAAHQRRMAAERRGEKPG